MQQYEEIAKSVVTYYYQTFTTNRQGLAALYRPTSMLTFEGTPVQGTESIVAKLISLPITTVVPVLDTMDAQPSGGNNVLVCVTGRMQVDGGVPEGMRFSQTFQLMPEANGNYYIFNDVFRLNYG